MTTYGSGSVGFLIIGGYDIASDMAALNEEVEQLLEENTGFSLTWPTHAQVGLKKAAYSQNGFYNDTAAKSNEALVGLTGTSRVGMLALAGNTVGKMFRGFAGLIQSKYTRQVQVGALHKAAAEHAVSGQVEEGKILHALGAETAASGNTDASSVDGSASSSSGAAYFAVTSLTLGGYTNLALKVRHSADNVTFADLASATVVTASPAAERVAIAATINRYTSCSWSFTGAGAGQTATFTVGVVRN